MTALLSKVKQRRNGRLWQARIPKDGHTISHPTCPSWGVTMTSLPPRDGIHVCFPSIWVKLRGDSTHAVRPK